MKKLLTTAAIGAMLAAGTAIAMQSEAPAAPKKPISKAEMLARADARFDRLDTNKDGAITLAEFEAGALERFKRQDTNNDGQVTKAERDAAREAMKQRWQEKRAKPAG